MDSIPAQAFQSSLLLYLDEGGDSALVNTFEIGKKLSQSIKDSSTCIHALSMKQAADEAVYALRLLLEWKSSSYLSQCLATSKFTADTIDSAANFVSAALIRDLKDFDASEFYARHHENPLGAHSITSSSTDYKDSLEYLLIQSGIQMSESAELWRSEQEREFVKIAEARVTHGLKMEEARTRIFMLALAAWFVSLLVMSMLYVRSVFRRVSASKGYNLNLDDVHIDVEQDLVQERQPVEIDRNGVSNDVKVPQPLITDIDLSKVFFDCGGDIQLMKKAVNRHLTTTFAAIGNLKSYQRSGNSDGAIRVIKVLSVSNAEMGFASMQSQLDMIAEQLSISGADQWKGMADLLLTLTEQMETLKDRLGSHPAFKN